MSIIYVNHAMLTYTDLNQSTEGSVTNMVKSISGMKLNESVETKEALPGMEVIMGENMKLVGVSYTLLGDSGVLQEVKAWAKGFNREDYEE